MQIFLVLCAVLQLSVTAGFSIGCNSCSKARSTSSSRSVLKASTQDGKNRVRIKKIVDALSSGTKSGAEIEQELKALQTESKLLEISTGVAGSLIGLVAGGLLDGALAGGNAPWSAPVGFVLLGGAVYYGAVQQSKEDVSDFLQSVLGQPVLKASKSAVGSIQNYVDESKAAAVKKIEDTVEEINRVPTSIIKSIVDAKDDAKAAAVKKVEDTVEEINRVPTSIIKSIVDAKDDAVTRAKLIPTNIQTAASRSYEEAKQGAINKVDQKVSEVSLYPDDSLCVLDFDMPQKFSSHITTVVLEEVFEKV